MSEAIGYPVRFAQNARTLDTEPGSVSDASTAIFKFVSFAKRAAELVS